MLGEETGVAPFVFVGFKAPSGWHLFAVYVLLMLLCGFGEETTGPSRWHLLAVHVSLILLCGFGEETGVAPFVFVGFNAPSG